MNPPIPHRVQELSNLRDDSKKVYLLSDNSKEAVFYPHPIHFYCTTTEGFEEIGSCYDPDYDSMLSEYDIPERPFHGFRDNPFEPLDTTHPLVSYTYTAPHFKKEALHTVSNKPRTPSYLAIEVLFPRVAGNAVIKKALLSLSIEVPTRTTEDDIRLELFYVPKPICRVTEIDLSALEKIASLHPHFEGNAPNECVFDLSAILPQASAQTHPVTLLIKLTAKHSTGIQIRGSEDYTHPPTLRFVYDTNFATNPQSGVLEHAVGDFGTGAIHPVTGHLLLDINDSIFDTYDKPIDIHHCYTSALAGYTYTYNPFLDLEIPAFNTMKLGRGWRLNIMESMTPVHFYHKNCAYNGFLYVNGNGVKTYFKPHLYAQDSFDPYATLYEGISPYTLYYDAEKRLLLSGDEERFFDDCGRLICMKTSKDKCVRITYSEERIQKVTEENSRCSVDLHYDKDNFLTQIIAYSQVIDFSYKDGTLHEITYPGGQKLVLESDGYYRGPSAILLKNNRGDPVSELLYSYTPSCCGARVTSITQKKHISYPCFELQKG